MLGAKRYTDKKRNSHSEGIAVKRRAQMAGILGIIFYYNVFLKSIIKHDKRLNIHFILLLFIIINA